MLPRLLSRLLIQALIVLAHLGYSAGFTTKPSIETYPPRPRAILATRREFLVSTSLLTSAMEEGNQPTTIRTALLGAGIFAREAHAPILARSPSFDCVAVWSRRLESASVLADELGAEAFSGEASLEEVLARKDIDAIVMALPLDVQPDLVRRVLRSGKHLLSEKPIAPTVAIAREMVEEYEKVGTSRWLVAENFRYEPAIQRMADIVRTVIGKPYLVSLLLRAPFLPDNQYLNTPWRKNPSWGDGGLFIDSLVHMSAAMRLVMGGNALSVQGTTTSNADYLPGMDTLVATVEWPAGATGVVSISYACQERKIELEVTGTQGSALLRRGGTGWQILIGEQMEEFPFQGIENEYEAFAAAIRGSREEDTLGAPRQALLDLAFVEACLTSGSCDGLRIPVEST